MDHRRVGQHLREGFPQKGGRLLRICGNVCAMLAAPGPSLCLTDIRPPDLSLKLLAMGAARVVVNLGG